MSRKIKKKYSAFSREILREFVSEQVLKEIDRQYTIAKIQRHARKLGLIIKRKSRVKTKKHQ